MKVAKLVCNCQDLVGVAWGARLQVVTGGTKTGKRHTGKLIPLDESVLDAGSSLDQRKQRSTLQSYA